MRLRNKKTGEIKDVESLGHEKSLRDKYGPQITLSWNTEYENLGECKTYNSLAELNEEWEDYQEPETFWYISSTGTPIKSEVSIYDPLEIHLMKQIGNYFESEEDADKAVEKLVALKRLENHNLRVEMGQRIFVNADNKLTSQKPLFVVDTYDEVEDDLDSLFCSEDDYEPTNAEINDLTDMGYGG